MVYTIEERGYETPCWIDQGALNGCGYGRHRRMYESRVGPVPDGLELHHRCFVRACIRPDHLEPVDEFQNRRIHNTARLAQRATPELLAEHQAQLERLRTLRERLNQLRKD